MLVAMFGCRGLGFWLNKPTTGGDARAVEGTYGLMPERRVSGWPVSRVI